MPVAGEVEQRTGNPFWGSKGEEEGQEEVIGIGGRSSVVQAAPAGEDRGGGAAPVWGRAGAAAWTRCDGWGSLNQRGGGAQ
jgi:hypothetical protein